MDLNSSSIAPTITLVIPTSSQTAIVRANDSRTIEIIEEEDSNGESTSETVSPGPSYRPLNTGALPHRTTGDESLQSILVNRGTPNSHDDQNNPPNTGEVQTNQTSLLLNRPRVTNTGRGISYRHTSSNNPNNAIPANVIRIPTPTTSRSSVRNTTREPRLPPSSRAGSPTLFDPTENNNDLPATPSPVLRGQNIFNLEDLPPLRHSYALIRHMEMYACNFDAEFSGNKLSIRLEANQPHTRVDLIRDDNLGVISHFWFVDPYNVEYVDR